MALRFCFCFFLAILPLPAQTGRGGRGGGAAFGQAQGQNQAPPPPADCAASGTVVNAMTGEAISHAMVSFSGGDGAGAATDAMGKWSIANTTCGARRIAASHPGFISSNLFESSGAARSNSIQLVSGAPVTGQKIPLMPEASVTGKVQDTEGDPLPSMVQIFRVRLQSGKRVLQGGGATSTDAQGNFRIGGARGRALYCVRGFAANHISGGRGRGPGLRRELLSRFLWPPPGNCNADRGGARDPYWFYAHTDSRRSRSRPHPGRARLGAGTAASQRSTGQVRWSCRRGRSEQPDRVGWRGHDV